MSDEQDPAFWAEYHGRSVRIEASRYGVDVSTVCLWLACPQTRTMLTSGETVFADELQAVLEAVGAT